MEKKWRRLPRMEDIRRIERWDNGGWWFRALLIKGNRVNARYRRKISRMVRQMLNQEEKKGGRQKWKWENLRKGG